MDSHSGSSSSVITGPGSACSISQLKNIENVQNNKDLYLDGTKSVEDNAFEVRLNVLHENPLIPNSTTSQQNLRGLVDVLKKVRVDILKKVRGQDDVKKELETLHKVLIDIQGKVQRGEDVVKKLENLEKRKMIFRRAMVTAALVTTICAAVLAFHYPQALAVALVSLTFLQFLMQPIENNFKEEQEKLKVEMEKFTADSPMLDEIGAVVEKLKVEFQSQGFVLTMTNTGNQEIIKKIDEYFTRILEKKVLCESLSAKLDTAHLTHPDTVISNQPFIRNNTRC